MAEPVVDPPEAPEVAAALVLIPVVPPTVVPTVVLALDALVCPVVPLVPVEATPVVPALPTVVVPLDATVLLPPVVPEMPLQASPVANHDAAHHRPTTHRRLIIYQGTGTSNAAASAKVRTTTPRCCAPEPRAIRSHSCPRASEGPPEEVASGETPLSTPRNRSRYLRAYHSMTLGWVFTASCCRKIFGFALNTSTGM